MWPIALLSMTGCGLRGGLYIFMFRSYFEGIPKELEEAGSIDGADHFRIFRSIILPSASSITVTCFLFSFVWQWTDTFYVYAGQFFASDSNTGSGKPGRRNYVADAGRRGSLLSIYNEQYRRGFTDITDCTFVSAGTEILCGECRKQRYSRMSKSIFLIEVLKI